VTIRFVRVVASQPIFIILGIGQCIGSSYSNGPWCIVSPSQGLFHPVLPVFFLLDCFLGENNIKVLFDLFFRSTTGSEPMWHHNQEVALVTTLAFAFYRLGAVAPTMYLHSADCAMPFRYFRMGCFPNFSFHLMVHSPMNSPR